MLHTPMPRPENRCRHGIEAPPVLHAVRSEAFAEDLPEPTIAVLAAAGGTMPAPWWQKVFDAHSLKSRGVVGVPAGLQWGSRPA